MAKGRAIVLTVEPKGVFKEGIATGILKAGICAQIDVSEAPIGGRLSWEAAAPGGDGQRMLMAIVWNSGLDGSTQQGDTASGSRVNLYCPIPGDELNVLVQASAGALTRGDLLILDNGTGKFIKTTGSPESEPFVVMEVSADVATDRLVHVMYTGM